MWDAIVLTAPRAPRCRPRHSQGIRELGTRVDHGIQHVGCSRLSTAPVSHAICVVQEEWVGPQEMPIPWRTLGFITRREVH